MTRGLVKKEVLDTAALISWPVGRMKGCYATPSQKIELYKIYPKKEIEIESADLIWLESDGKSFQIATKLAEETGDMAGLSKIDLGILALSIFVSGTLITDDYRLQNRAQTAGIKWETVSTDGITKIWKWELRCTACKKIHAQPKKPNPKKSDWGICQDCGSKLKLKKIE